MAQLVDNETGQVVEVADHDQAVSALQSGTHGLRADAPVNLIAPDGSIVNADAANTAELFGAGYKLAGQAEVARDLERQQYGEGFGNEAAAFTEGAVSGATMGLSDIAARAIDDEYATDLAKRREYNPISAGLGEATGVIGTSLLSGGTGALGSAARALPASLAMRTAESAGAKLATQGVRALGQVAAQGALEGALFGATKAVSDDYLNNHEITAERIAIGAGLGGLTGGIFGAGTHAIGTALSKGGDLATQAARGLVGRLGGQADDAGRAALSTADDAVLAAGQGAEKAGKAGALRSFGDASTATKRLDETAVEAAREATAAATRNAKRADDALILSQGGLKESRLREIMSAEPPPNISNAVDTTADLLGQVDDELSALSEMTNRHEKGSINAFYALREDIDQIASKMRPPSTPEEAGSFYREIDRLKTRIGRERVKLGRNPGNESGEGVLNDMYERVRTHLEDANIWGKATSDFQRENNVAIRSYLQYSRGYDNLVALPRNLQTMESGRDVFETVAAADPNKVTSLMRNAGEFTSSEAERIVVEGAQRQADMLAVLGKNYNLSASHMDEFAAAQADAKLIADKFKEVAKLRETGKSFQNAMDAISEFPVLGGVVAKGVQSAGRGVHMFTKLAADDAAQATARASAFHTAAVRAADKAERLMDSAASAVVKATKSRAVRSIADSATVLGYEFLPAKAGSVKGLADHLDDVIDENGKERGRVRAKLWSARQVSPEMAAAMEQQAVVAAKFLREKTAESMPTGSPSDMFAALRKPGQYPLKAKRLANYADAVAHPEKVISRVKGGEVRREDLEVLRKVYPQMAQRLANAILMNASSAKRLPSAEVQQTLAELTGLPVGRANPVYTAALQNLIRTAPTSQALQEDRRPRRSNGSSKVASMYAPPSEVNEHM